MAVLDRREAGAVGMLQLVLDNSLIILRDRTRGPESRLDAMRTARDLLSWDAGTETLKYSEADRSMVSNPLAIKLLEP